MHSQGEKREIIMNNAINNSITGGLYGMVEIKQERGMKHATNVD